MTAVIACALWTASPANAQSPMATTQPALPSLDVPRAAHPPKMDASPDDPAWNGAVEIPSLSLCTGGPPGLEPSPTRVRLMWDAKNLYIRFICVDRDIYAPFGTQQGAAHFQGDVVEVFLDPVGDSEEFLELGVNPVGGFDDGVHVLTAPAVSGADGTLDPKIVSQNWWFIPNWEIKGMHIATATVAAGTPQQEWIADIALPAAPVLRRLGLKQYQPMTLRANLLRYDADTPVDKAHIHSVFMAWNPVPWGRPHRSPALMGRLNLVDK